MNPFTFYNPTEVIFGPGAESKTGDAVKRFGGTRALVIYGGKSAAKSGLLNRVEENLKAAGVAVSSLGGVQPNPHLSLVRRAVKQAQDFRADFILAVGGGSVIDTAKAVAHGAASPQTDVWDYWLGKAEVKKSLPVGVVLTISAAGSETSDSAVITNEQTQEKRGINTPFNRPKFAVMNPELTYTLPPVQIACGVTDILMHTLDRYFTHMQGNELTDHIAEALMRTVIQNGPRALKNPRDYHPQSELMWCGSLSHNGLTGLGAEKEFSVHQLGHELSGKYDVAHGASLSAVWASWARYVWQEDPSRFARYAREVWGIGKESDKDAATAGIDATEAFFKSLGMPVSLSELGVGPLADDALKELAAACTRCGARTVGRFKVLDTRDVYNIYKAANR